MYAKGTSVSVEKSKSALDAMLGKAGASSRGIMSDDANGQAAVVFRLLGGSYRLVVPLPKLGDFPARGKEPRDWRRLTLERQGSWRYQAWEQACRERWRLVVLLVKSKLEMVSLGASTPQREFMADLILANGKTVSEVLAADSSGLLLPEHRDDA